MKKVIAIVIILALFVIIRNIVVSITSLSRSNRELVELKNNLITSKRENQLLKERLKYVKTDTFVEEEARNKLNLARENEYIVVVPAEKTDSQTKQVAVNYDPNWKKWWDLFK